MKKYTNLIIGICLIVVGLISFPFNTFFVENQAYSVFSVLATRNFSFIDIVIALPTFCLIVGGVFLILSYKKSENIWITFILTLIGAVILLVPNEIYVLAHGLQESEHGVYPLTYILVVLSFLASLLLSSQIIKGNKFTVRDIVEIGMFISLAFIFDLSFLKIKFNAGAGSISFIMIPLFIIALRKGFVKGFISLGIIYGLLACLMDGYGFITYPFDYLLGFGLLSVVGIFKKYILQNDNSKFTIKGLLFLILGVLLGCVLRTLSSTISGMVFYGFDFVSSLLYQLSYMGVSSIISIVAMCVLYKPLLLINKIFPNSN